MGIETGLDPCSNHTRIIIKANKLAFHGRVVFMWKRNWDAINCSKLSSEAKPETDAETETKEREETNFFTEKSFQNTFILIISLLTIIAILATVSVCVIWKKKNRKREKRSEQMKTEENTMYGTYEDGPVYNVVTD